MEEAGIGGKTLSPEVRQRKLQRTLKYVNIHKPPHTADGMKDFGRSANAKQPPATMPRATDSNEAIGRRHGKGRSDEDDIDYMAVFF